MKSADEGGPLDPGCGVGVLVWGLLASLADGTYQGLMLGPRPP